MVATVWVFSAWTIVASWLAEASGWLAAQSPLSMWVPKGSPSRGGDVTVYVWHKPTELAHSFLFYSCVYFCLFGPFNCSSFHPFSRQLSVFWLCSSGLFSALLVLSTLYLFMKVSFSANIIPSGWLGSKHLLTNYQCEQWSGTLRAMSWLVFLLDIAFAVDIS